MTAPTRVPALDLDHARSVAATVTDPELPMLTLADLGVLRSVSEEDGRVVVGLTPTYSGCPAMATMRDDLVARLAAAGYDAEVRVELSPAWSSDDITAHGRRGAGPSRDLAAGPGRSRAVRSGGALPRPAPAAGGLPSLRESTRPDWSRSSDRPPARRSTPAGACGEPFDHVKEI